MIKIETLVLGQMQSNCYIVYNTENSDAVIIDPGAQPHMISERIENICINVTHILLTHAHFDHIGAVDEISLKYDCDIILCRDDEELLTDPVLNLSHSFGTDITVKSKNIILVGDQSVNLIGERFDFIQTPGHSNGSMCIRVSDALFTGDTLFYCSVGNDFPPYGSIETETASIKNKLFVLDGDYICYPGHGRITTLDFEKKHNPYVSGE